MPSRSDGHAERTLKRMRHFFSTDQLSDVILKAGDTEVKCHRLVLAASSDYFLAMFSCDMKESKAKLVEMHEIDGHALSQLVSFAYSGALELQENTVENTLATAEKLQFTEVVETCTEFISDRLDATNCIGYVKFAESRNCTKLHKAAFSYTEEHIMEVMENEEFSLLEVYDLKKILSSERLNIPSELDLYRGIRKWVDFDAGRKKWLESLLAFVKLPLLPPDVLVDELIPTIGKFSSSLVESCAYHLLPDRISRFPANITTPRKSSVGNLYYVSFTEIPSSAHNLSILKYSPYSDEWSHVKDWSVRINAGFGYLGERILMIGGWYYNSGQSVADVDFFDTSTKSFGSLSGMSKKRHSLAVATADNDAALYAIGGVFNFVSLNTVETLEPGTGIWTTINPMQTIRGSPGACFLQNRLYVAGGFFDSWCSISWSDSVEAYDPLSGRWSYCAPLKQKRTCRLVASCGQLYAIGGCTDSTVPDYPGIERYDPRNNSWQPTANPLGNIRLAGVAVLGNRIYVVGGNDGEKNLQTVAEYDPIADTWCHLRPLGTPSWGFCFPVKKNS